MAELQYKTASFNTQASRLPVPFQQQVWQQPTAWLLERKQHKPASSDRRQQIGPLIRKVCTALPVSPKIVRHLVATLLWQNLSTSEMWLGTSIASSAITVGVSKVLKYLNVIRQWYGDFPLLSTFLSASWTKIHRISAQGPQICSHSCQIPAHL